MEFRIKRGAYEGVAHRLACLLNAGRIAGCHGLGLQNLIDEPLQRYHRSRRYALRRGLELIRI